MPTENKTSKEKPRFQMTHVHIAEMHKLDNSAFPLIIDLHLEILALFEKAKK